MRIASIDYGLSTGLAITILEETEKKIFLNHYLVCTIKDNIPSVLNFVQAARCYSVVLEQRPSRASDIGLDTYEKTLAGLKELGYHDSNKIFEEHALVAISPGVWKPFVKHQWMEYAKWSPESPHEIDAIGLLYYAVRTQTNPNKEIELCSQ
jgi:hypothetical protein